MHLTTALPLGALYFKHWHVNDTEVGVCVAKAAFEILPDGALKTVRPAPDIILEDAFDGDPAMGVATQEQEFAPSKTGTDILIRAIAHAPGGKALSDWPVSVSIPDRLDYTFQVRGPARWDSGLLGWKMTDPEPVTEVPISYALAYGGAAQGDPEAEAPEVFEENPAGLGYATPESLKGKASFPAPQIGELAEFMRNDVTRDMMVHGTGPIAKAWVPRRAFAGTFDEEWEQTRHPRMPRDYDLSFWNCAHPRLQLRPFLRGDETIILTNMTPGGGPRRITLPGIRIMLAATGDGISKNHTMKLDTVDIDVSDSDPTRHRVNILWRARVTGPERFTAGDLQSSRLE